MLKGYRTIGFNLIAALLPITDAALMFLGEAQSIMPPLGYLIYAVVMSAANLYLRKITTTAVGEK